MKSHQMWGDLWTNAGLFGGVMKELENPYGNILEVRRWRNIEGKKTKQMGSVFQSTDGSQL